MPNYQDYAALGRGLNSLAGGFNNVYGSGKSQAAFNDWYTQQGGSQSAGNQPAGPPQNPQQQVPVGARVGRYVPAASLAGAKASGNAAQSAAAPPPQTNPSTPEELYALSPDQRDTILNGIPPAVLAKNPMARNERMAVEGMPMNQTAAGPPRAAGRASGGASGTTQGATGAIPSAPPAANQGAAGPAGMMLQLSPQAMMDLQQRLAIYGDYGKPYLQAGQGLYDAQLAAAEQEYKRQIAEREYQQQEMKTRRDFAMDSAEALIRNKDFMMNPEAMPYMGNWMSEIYGGNFSPTYNVPEQPLPDGVQGPPNPAQQVSMFMPRPEEPDFQYIEGPTRADGTQQILQIDKRTGKVTPVHQTSGIRVPGSGGSGASGQWAQYEKDPRWKHLHKTRRAEWKNYEELSRAKRELQAKTPSEAQIKKYAKDYTTTEEQARQDLSNEVTVQANLSTGKRAFTSVEQIEDEQRAIRKKFDDTTDYLEQDYGWTPKDYGKNKSQSAATGTPARPPSSATDPVLQNVQNRSLFNFGGY